ncbi:uncharacterized protein SPPG_00212 [Spizellomyces punctatus DAOM BR117]|uniref:Uncharacterized protein n=1 Tax=Spizellomyces punctatus (strain DAOM BR117) TaxID=645134 RepID=A0A0L0HUD6_SPIPD|nr:uncharacterized protein SPPG_00212 [Spizellomyces punctatus DAOM BR117]KND04484.1 hypothetical protein SPPG_00212 [Spizellomyces punctatus DAOM BR117]|eukprot:XP_016612523.1 hypothetical protein SPPG_00212 [Spizellomyces punctatus DAOM BR117]
MQVELGVNLTTEMEQAMENIVANGPGAKKRSKTKLTGQEKDDCHLAASSKRKRAKKSFDSDDDQDSQEGECTKHIASRSNHSKRRGKPPQKGNAGGNGSISFCDRCQRRYLVEDDAQALCPACLSIQTNRSGAEVLRKGRKKRGKVIPEGSDEGGPVKSLRNLCIKLIADYIDQVEEFGDISEATKLQIAKIIGRYRQLNSTNVRLFIGPGEDRLNLSECTYLDEKALSEVAYMSPNVHQLYLGNCGRITDNVLKIIGENCTSLASLSLSGPFLPSSSGFITLFQGLGEKLKELSLQHAAKLDKAAVEVLVQRCPNLTLLRFDQCLKLGDEGIRLIADLKHLDFLELSRLGEKVSEESLIHVIRTVGAQLRVLSLNGHSHLTDKVLNEAIVPTCERLQEISMEESEGLTSAGMVDFFGKLKAPSGLSVVSLSRNVHMNDDVIVAIVNHFGTSLQQLNLNGLDELTDYSLGAVATGCPNLTELDVSWIRNVNDSILEKLLANSRSLSKVKVYGCNKLSEFIINRRWINKYEQDIRFVGNEYI